MRAKAGERGGRTEIELPAADEKNSGENGDDPRPLPVRNVFLEEYSRKTDGNRSVQRTKNADDRDLLHFHSETAKDKGAGIQGPHTQGHPPHLAAWTAHGLLRTEHY